MPLICAFVYQGKSYLVSDMIDSSQSFNRVHTNPSRWRIQNFGDVTLAYYGSTLDFQKLIAQCHFDKMPSDVNFWDIYRNFYPNFLNFLDNDLGAEKTNRTFNKYDFCLYILTKNAVFDISDESAYQVKGLNASGNNSVAFNLFNRYKEEKPLEEILKNIFDESSKTYDDLDYPYMVVCSDNVKVATIYNKDGSKKQVKLKRNFED